MKTKEEKVPREQQLEMGKSIPCRFARCSERKVFFFPIFLFLPPTRALLELNLPLEPTQAAVVATNSMNHLRKTHCIGVGILVVWICDT